MTGNGMDNGQGGGPGDPEDGDDLRAAEYAMGLLDPEERRAIEERLLAEPALRDRVASWERDLARMADTVDPVVPPAALRRRIERRLFGRPVALWRRMGFGPALLAATVAVVVVIAGLRLGWQALPQGAPFVAQLAATEAVEDAPETPVARIALDPEAGRLTVRLTGLAPGPGRAHELWLIEEGADPVSLGLLRPGAAVTLPLPPALRGAVAPGTLLAISDEPEGGSPTGQPTGAVLAAGPITAS